MVSALQVYISNLMVKFHFTVTFISLYPKAEGKR